MSFFVVVVWGGYCLLVLFVSSQLLLPGTSPSFVTSVRHSRRHLVMVVYLTFSQHPASSNEGTSYTHQSPKSEPNGFTLFEIRDWGRVKGYKGYKESRYHTSYSYHSSTLYMVKQILMPNIHLKHASMKEKERDVICSK
jgi:hypothetical protein